MKTMLWLAVGLLASAPIAAVELVQKVELTEAELGGQANVNWQAGDAAVGASRAVVESPGAGPVEATLLVVEKPAITQRFYALRGRVRHERVQGRAFLEMWSHFPDGSTFFSRTLGESGPMRHLEGDGGWREFVLPFDRQGSAVPPSRLVLRVVLPEAGRVEVAPEEVVQAQRMDGLLTATGAWFGDATGGLVGGIGGALLGLLGAVVGWLGSRGRARRAVVGALIAAVALGAAAGAVGLYAVVVGQPYAVWFSLMMTGGLAVVICGCLLPVLTRRYRELELRRINALDA
jgi:hypothetical protein